MLADPVQLDRIRSQNGRTFHTWIPEHIRISVILLLCKRKKCKELVQDVRGSRIKF